MRPSTPAELTTWLATFAYPVCAAGLAVMVGFGRYQAAVGWLVALVAAAVAGLPGWRAGRTERAAERNRAAYPARTDPPPHTPSVLVPVPAERTLPALDGPAVSRPYEP